MPAADEGVVLGWKKDGCNVEIKEGDSIAMLHGPWGGTWAADLDERVIAEMIFHNLELLNEMLVIKTPGGYHLIFYLDPEDLPDKDITFYHTTWKDKDPKTGKMKIDIRHKGYTMLPFSNHPKSEVRYEFNSTNYIPKKMGWKAFVQAVGECGFFNKDTIDEIGPHGKKYEYVKLLNGGFTQGERRVKQKSLYIHRRIRGDAPEQAEKKLQKINMTCVPPTSDKEFNENMRSAENYFTNRVEPEMKLGNVKMSKKTDKDDLYAFADIIMERCNIVTINGREALYYENGVYVKMGAFLIEQMARSIWRDIGINQSDCNEIINIITSKTGIVDVKHFDEDHTKINLKNGLYDVTTGELLPHDPKYLSFMQYNVTYDRTKRCPKFIKFLRSTLEDDKVKIWTILEMMALCFIPKSIVEKAYILVGNGANGKSTLLNIITAMVKIENISAKTIQNFAKNEHSASVLEGKAANISADIGKQSITNTETIKKIIGGDPLDCDKKFKDPYAFRSRATAIFSCNEPPEVDDSSNGFTRKFEMIKFEVEFAGKDRDFSVGQIQYDDDELSGIMNMLLDMMPWLIKKNRLHYESTAEMTRNEWTMESDSVQRFTEDMTVMGDGYSVSKAVLFGAYRIFCNQGKYRPRTLNKFNEKIRDMGLIAKNKRIGKEVFKSWTGITLRSELKAKDQEVI